MEQLELSSLEKKLYEKMQWLEMKLSDQKELVIEYADSEKTYRIALRIEMLKAKSEGQAATIISDLARGEKTVAELKWQRDVKKGTLDACKSAIESLQVEISGFQTLISRHRAEMNLR